MSARPALDARGDGALRAFVLSLGDPVLVVDGAGHVSLANAAAEQRLGASLSRLPASLGEVFGASLGARVQTLLTYARDIAGGHRHEPDSLRFVLPDGRPGRLTLHRLEGGHWLLRLHDAAPPPNESDAAAAAVARELIGMFWDSPFPASLQDAEFRLIAVNDAYVEFTGFRRDQLVGRDAIDLQPQEDRALSRELRRQSDVDAGPRGGPSGLIERRIVDAGGRERWFRAATRSLTDDQGRRLHLAVLHDCTAEHAAREQADRTERDLDQWFDMSPLGMVLYDDSGLLVRTNPAFEEQAGRLPETLAEAAPGVQSLLAWDDGAPSPLLVPGAAALARDVWLHRADGSARRLRARVRAYETPGGYRRYMAAVEDLSAEEERDLARMQMGAVMDTAGVGIATFDDAGWRTPLASPPSALPSDAVAAANAPAAGPRTGATLLQSIGRDLVQAESLPEYERLQQALRQGQRAEVRYAIRHPELGLRWLLTRVEPGQLASGKRTTSVVTLDVTDQEQARIRNEQLLRELGTILESSPAGIVYLRGDVLVRCNRRFERMVGLAPGSAAGRSARELFVGMPVAHRMVDDFLQAIEQGALYETEFQLPRPDGAPQWVSLSAQSFRTAGGSIDAIAVLSDVTRLKSQQTELETLARDRELMFNLSEVGIAFIRDGRIQRANEALQQLTGHDAAALAGLEISVLFTDRASFHQRWAVEDAALRQHGRWSGERQLRRADGSLLWVQVSKRLVMDGDPGGGIIASYANVDDRHRAEASLAQQAETTRAVLDSVLVGIVTVGRHGIEWMNRSARRMFGGSLADFVGQPISTVATPEPDHPFRRTHYLDALTEGQAETFDCQVMARDGRVFWVAGNAVVVRHAGRDRQLTYALLDIERRRSAELRTAEAQAALQRVIDMAPLAISVHDAHTLDALELNQTARRVTGVRDADGDGDGAGRPLETLYPAELAAQQRRDMTAALALGRVSKYEYRIETDGESRLWEARMMPLSHDDAAPDQLLMVATDVTEQRAAEQARLDAAIAQREMLVKEVHHRIKNNLQGVAGLLQQIAQRRPEVADVIAEVVGQVQAIAQVYGLQVGAAGPLRLKSVVEAIIGSVQRTFGRDITLTIGGAEAARWHEWGLPESESIPIALTVNELLTNAIKHSQPGALRCGLDFETTGVRLSISNPGRLRDEFDLARVPGGVSGLGLVRALLPRRHSKLAIRQDGDRVEAVIDLVPPGVTRLQPL